MATPPADHEDSRLRALQALNILDTPAEERFDRITRLAARIFEVPMAAITLIDRARQWFKSAHGMSVTEMPRESSFCAHTIRSESPFVVSNALLHPRFAESPLVTGPIQARFYAGRALAASDGSRIGTLCVLDRQPRQVSARELEMLQDLARIAEDELQARRLSRAQQELAAERDSLKKQALIDPLTHLWNRAAIVDVLKRELHRSARDQRSLAVIMADIDHFKKINDEHGHLAGDEVLREVARRFRTSVRRYDAVGRYGGEEFLIVLVNADFLRASRSAERIRTEIGAYDIAIPDGKIKVTVSLGLACATPLSGLDWEQLVVAADEALYEAKRQGRNRMVMAGRTAGGA